MIPVLQERFTYKLLKSPQLRSRQLLGVMLDLNFEIDVITYPTAINLSAWVPFSTGLVGIVGRLSAEWLAEPNMAVGRAIRTTPTRLTTDTFLSRRVPFEIGIEFTGTYFLHRPLDAENFHLERGPQPLPYTWVQGKQKQWHLTKRGTVGDSRLQRGQKICEKPFEPKLNDGSGEGGPNKTSEQQQ